MEDSYLCMDTLSQVQKEEYTLSRRLLYQMRLDLMQPEHDATMEALGCTAETQRPQFRWLALPKTIRLSLRPKGDGSKNGKRSFRRISRTALAPSFLFSHGKLEDVALRLARDSFMPLYRQMLPEVTSNWNLSLINVAVTDISRTTGNGNVRAMLMSRDTIRGPPRRVHDGRTAVGDGSVTILDETSNGMPECEDLQNLDQPFEDESRCTICGVRFPVWAIEAHNRYHDS